MDVCALQRGADRFENETRGSRGLSESAEHFREPNLIWEVYHPQPAAGPSTSFQWADGVGFSLPLNFLHFASGLRWIRSSDRD